MKVGYIGLTGFRSTAYLDEDENTGCPMRGENKYTDETVWVVWNQDRDDWLEVAAP